MVLAPRGDKAGGWRIYPWYRGSAGYCWLVPLRLGATQDPGRREEDEWSICDLARE